MFPRVGNRIPPGGKIRRRREQQQFQTPDTSEQLTVISKNPASESDSDDEYQYAPNVFLKEEKERIFIKESLKSNFLFQDLSTNGDEENDYHHSSDIVKSFEKHVYKKGDFLCKQGDT